ncbi:DMT family transporter [Labrenzia sp. DG1229]|uniref:DMT family transporter n=1 Tax=Labrenzia sp. DG1229 TaxID=681847 RepID=UPI000491FBAB|nr:DMT family transporter [Labrenzia sp. DG1229]
MSSTTLDARAQATIGIVLMSVGIASLSVSDAIAKALTAGYSPIQILFIRNLIALPFAVVIALSMGGPGALRSYRPAAHLLRGVFWLLAAVLFFTGLKHLEIAEATALVFVAPVFITAISALFLKETVGWRRWLAVLAGFAGVLVIVRPGAGTFQNESLLPIATAFLYAILMISARWVDPRESVWTLMLYLVGAGALLSALAVPFAWVEIQSGDVWMFVGIAIFGTAGITLITQAFRFASAATVAPFEYSALIWATLLGWIIWDEIPDMLTYVGAGIIILSGCYIVFREQKLQSEETT